MTLVKYTPDYFVPVIFSSRSFSELQVEKEIEKQVPKMSARSEEDWDTSLLTKARNIAELPTKVRTPGVWKPRMEGAT